MDLEQESFDLLLGHTKVFRYRKCVIEKRPRRSEVESPHELVVTVAFI